LTGGHGRLNGLRFRNFLDRLCRISERDFELIEVADETEQPEWPLKAVPLRAVDVRLKPDACGSRTRRRSSSGGPGRGAYNQSVVHVIAWWASLVSPAESLLMSGMAVWMIAKTMGMGH
jgi:hypothetical protein